MTDRARLTTSRSPAPLLSASVCALTAAASILVGCLPDSVASDPAAIDPVSLVANWSKVEIEDPVSPPRPSAQGAVVFDGSAEGLTWEALQGVEGLRIEDGRLVGRSTSEQPAILVTLPEPAGSEDELWSVETRLEVADGTRMAVHPALDPGPPMQVNLARIEEWPISSPLLPGAGTKTYTTELDDVFLLEMMPATRGPRKILLRPTDAAGVDFAVDSMRLVFRREHLASIESGPGWHGLGEVFRESLVSRPGETLVFEAQLSARPWLELAVGAVAEPLPSFEVAVAPATSGGGAEATTIATIRPTKADAWHAERIDLAEWAGETIRLRLQARNEEGDAAPALWGTPTVRSALTETADAERPQTVILFLADTLRKDHLAAWGHERETAPTLSRLAAEGVRFDDAVAQSTWTKVSVSSILTSLYPSTTGVAGLSDRISAGETTLAEIFRQAGYATFATSSVPFTGQLTNLHQGVEVLYEFGAIPRGEAEYTSKTSRVWVDAYLEWLEMHRDVPTFAFIHAMDPHSPFEPEPPYDRKWASDEDAARFAEQADAVRPHIKSPLLQRFMAPSEEELAIAGVDAETFVRYERNQYDGSILAMDVEVERMMGALDELGLTGASLLGFVSDHGEEFLEHGQHWHGATVYGEVTNVPMVLWGSGVPAGRVVERTVQTIDLYPTMVELAGLEVPERAQGQSLLPLLSTETATQRQRPAFVELPAERPAQVTRYAILDGSWKLVWNRGVGEPGVVDREGQPVELPEYELYDHEADPLNLEDRAEAHPEVVASLAEQLERWLSWAEEQKLDESEEMADMSAEELEQLRSLGYVE
ncbi:MAG: sulfatase-like hydrolase/transferase [Thermoanaerobaculia bacterium]|nr:sulfatase-like hydrolase/transferase [Thermoanaerobaculia bacterium]